MVYNFVLFFKRKLSIWSADQSSDKFEPRILCQNSDLDGECTELKV